MFVTSQGSAHGRFTRAIQQRHLLNAETAARELGRLSLDDALELTLLIAERDRDRYERAALKWHARFELEAKGLTLAESQFVLAALNKLNAQPPEEAGRALDVLRGRPASTRRG